MESTTGNGHGIRMASNPKWIRGRHGGHTVVDSRRVLFAWENPHYPAWYVPLDDVVGELVANGNQVVSDVFGTGSRFDLLVGDHRITDVAVRYEDCPAPELRDRIRFDWDAIDSWFEEEVEVFVHPRSPETRVDVLPSSRAVRVLIDGVEIAHSTRTSILFETGLPARYYVPKSDVRMEMLRPTATSTACPYKGFASYWSVAIGDVVHEDIAWSYRTPLPESQGIAGLVCFYNEHVDIEIDGRPEPRPESVFSADRFA